MVKAKSVFYCFTCGDGIPSTVVEISILSQGMAFPHLSKSIQPYKGEFGSGLS